MVEIATLPQRCVTVGQHLMGLIAVSLRVAFQSHAPDIGSILYSFFFLVVHSGCENRALYNSITGQCDCMPGNSGPLCGECRVVMHVVGGVRIHVHVLVKHVLQSAHACRYFVINHISLARAVLT